MLGGLTFKATDRGESRDPDRIDAQLLPSIALLSGRKRDHSKYAEDRSG